MGCYLLYDRCISGLLDKVSSVFKGNSMKEK